MSFETTLRKIFLPAKNFSNAHVNFEEDLTPWALHRQGWIACEINVDLIHLQMNVSSADPASLNSLLRFLTRGSGFNESKLRQRPIQCLDHLYLRSQILHWHGAMNWLRSLMRDQLDSTKDPSIDADVIYRRHRFDRTSVKRTHHGSPAAQLRQDIPASIEPSLQHVVYVSHVGDVSPFSAHAVRRERHPVHIE